MKNFSFKLKMFKGRNIYIKINIIKIQMMKARRETI